MSTITFSIVIKEPRTYTCPTMYCQNSNQILVTKVNLHTVVNRLLKDSRSQMQATILNMALTFRSPRKKDSQLGPFQIVKMSFML